jgi:uncharacterized protein YkwD
VGGQPGAAEVNNFRTSNGVAAMAWDDALVGKAAGWSQHMAAEGKLSHSTLSDGAPPGWHELGENVAVNSSFAAALTALENHQGHRENLLNPAFTRFAVGVVFQNGLYWVTQEFYG